MLITIQYLEDSPELLSLSPYEVREKLKRAFDSIPITHLLIGWQLPTPLLEVCRIESEKSGVKFFRWHPLLTGDGTFQPRPEWQVVGLNGNNIQGFQNMPEFTFVCPNHPVASAEILDHLRKVLGSGLYQGLFLDRVRWPSPASLPLQHLGCFCEYCRKAAMDEGIDITGIQKLIKTRISTQIGKIELIQALLGQNNTENDSDNSNQIEQWLSFRENSISRFVENISVQVRSSGLEIGLDCFSPGLTRMVGQDLATLSSYADWIKIMCYAHTLGPAGLPFEIIGLLDFLTTETGLPQKEAVAILSSALKIPLPPTREEIQNNGLNTIGLSLEVRKGVKIATIPVLAGLELVDIPGVAALRDDIIVDDHLAATMEGVAGLSISWDLLHIPEHRLNLVSPIWSK